MDDDIRADEDGIFEVEAEDDGDIPGTGGLLGDEGEDEEAFTNDLYGEY